MLGKTWFQGKCGSNWNHIKDFLESHFIYVLESQKEYKYKLESQINKKEMESRLDIIFIFGIIIVILTWNHKLINSSFWNHK